MLDTSLLLVCVIVLLSVMLLGMIVIIQHYIGFGSIWQAIRNKLPGTSSSFEQVYLRALSNKLSTTAALMVVGSSDKSRSDLRLMEAFCPITLRPYDNTVAAPDVVASADMLAFERTSSAQRRSLRNRAVRPFIEDERPISRLQRFVWGVMWFVAQALPLLIALALLAWLLWSPEQGVQLSWPRGAGALLIIGAWFLVARWLQSVLVGDDKLDELLAWWARRSECIAHPGTPGAEVWKHPRLLIRGDPGCGKTTLLRHMALICARDLRGESQKQHNDRIRDAYGWPTKPFPIYIPLRALSEAALQGTKPLLESYVVTLQQTGLLGAEMRHCPISFFTQCAEKGGCLILLDAFDELRDPTARRRLGALIADLPPGPRRNPNRVVVTCRIVGYEGQLDGAAFVQRRVEDLDDPQASKFIKARYTAIAAMAQRGLGPSIPLGWEPLEKAAKLTQRLPTNPGLRRLSRNPLLLSLAVAVHYDQGTHGKELPQERYRLYEEALKLMAGDWERLKNDESGPEPTDESSDLRPEEKLRLLRELAWVMFEQALEQQNSTAHAITTGTQAEAVLARTLSDIPGFAPEKTGEERTRHCQSEAKRWLLDLGQRGGVLQELGNVPGTSDVEIQFAHLTFQEYLTARAIATEHAEQRRTRMLRCWDDPRWREVLLLYAASADASPVIRHLLKQNALASQMLAGSVLVERPLKLERDQQDATVQTLRRLALTDTQVSEDTALEVWQLLQDSGTLPERPDLLIATRTAPQAGVRAKAIAVLVGDQPRDETALLRRVPVEQRASPRNVSEPLSEDVQQVLLQVVEHEQDYRPRLAAGFALARNDPRPAISARIPEMVEIPAGPFLMGSSDGDAQAHRDEKPQHEVMLPTYQIGKMPVTNAQWRHFVESDGYTNKDYWTEAGWRWVQRNEGRASLARLFKRRPKLSPLTQPGYWNDARYNGDNQPVVGVSWFEAVAYCRWLSAQPEAARRVFYLPSEAEWEKAVRGPHGLRYPWGNEWQPGCCNNTDARIGRPSPVGSFPAGASYYGVLDMAGNVYEWCATKYGKEYPYDVGEDEWSEAYLEDDTIRCLRGGSFTNAQRDVRGASRYYYRNPRPRDNDVGLRVASRSPRPNAES